MIFSSDYDQSSVQITHFSQASPLPHGKSTGGRIVYAIGDVHGCYDLLTALLEAIANDVAQQPDDSVPMLIFCGDYVDRGPRSDAVLTALIWLQRHAKFEVICLRGNHEDMFLDFIDHPNRNFTWLKREGKETLSSYGVAVPDTLAETDDHICSRLRDELLGRLPIAHAELLRHLPTSVTIGDFIFVHAGLRPGIALNRQTDEDRLWIREGFVDKDFRFKKVVVHGHTWNSDEPTVTENRIGIDTGAYQTQVLTAVRLENSNIRFLQAKNQSPHHWSIKTMSNAATSGKR